MSSTESAQWEPPGGHDWGESTYQAQLADPDVGVDEDSAGEFDGHTDAYEIRMRFGIPPFDPDDFDHDIYPDVLVHEKPATETKSAGGTDWLKIGTRGSGKSNDSLNWSARLMEVNSERVIWRGSPQRSEWLPFKEWTTLWLPEHASVDAAWETEGESGIVPGEADLEEIVRDVVRYEDPVDLLAKIEERPPGTFNVVFPDPSFTGCRELTRETDRVNTALPFTPKWRAFGEEEGTPLQHWWYAFMLAAVDERAAYSWLSIVFDEAGDLSPEDAEADAHDTYKKISLLRSVYSDSRRRRLSIFWCAHYEENLHHKIRREVQWRVDMADETANPRKSLARSIPTGFGTVKMHSDIMSDRKVGNALLYNESAFQLYKWKHIDRDDLGERWLSIGLGEPEQDEGAEDSAPAVQYDDSIFKRWTKSGEDRLYVRDPGSGYVDMKSGAEAEPLESPRDGWSFGPIEEDGEDYLITIQPDDDPEPGESAVAVAKFPQKDVGIDFEAELSEANP